ncbi:TraX family protein [Ramlibacter humi]|uniref:Conjugal transfer protein TraX n=1 Tax=Ramlibacter humi TaxID=2530451 RepID=A0A4Z0BJX8_9BURK|nr:TraX family protein [Ramlibacter humi]TFY98198.1 hypothetical protein EZ216_16480 [Ramlibacter humi]
MVTPALRTAPLGFTDGQLETLKWLALGSMVTDHIGRHLLGMPNESVPFLAGRIAFPLFALVLGLNLARQGDRPARSSRTALRLAAWGLVAVLPSIWARGDPQVVNVLVTLALGAGLCWAVDSPAAVPLRMLACIAMAIASWWCEFGVGGAFLVVAVYLYATRPDPGVALVALLLLFATGLLNQRYAGGPALWATVVAWPIAAAVHELPLSMPRWQLLFYAIYPLHLAAIGALKAWG